MEKPKTFTTNIWYLNWLEAIRKYSEQSVFGPQKLEARRILQKLFLYNYILSEPDRGIKERKTIESLKKELKGIVK